MNFTAAPCDDCPARQNDHANAEPVFANTSYLGADRGATPAWNDPEAAAPNGQYQK